VKLIWIFILAAMFALFGAWQDGQPLEAFHGAVFAIIGGFIATVAALPERL
jgi:hypothetical protein